MEGSKTRTSSSQNCQNGYIRTPTGIFNQSFLQIYNKICKGLQFDLFLTAGKNVRSSWFLSLFHSFCATKNSSLQSFDQIHISAPFLYLFIQPLVPENLFTNLGTLLQAQDIFVFLICFILFKKRQSNLSNLFNRIQKANPSSAEGEGAKAQWRSFLRSNQSIIVQVMISVNRFYSIILECCESNCVNTNNNCEGNQEINNIFSADTYSLQSEDLQIDFSAQLFCGQTKQTVNCSSCDTKWIQYQVCFVIKYWLRLNLVCTSSKVDIGTISVKTICRLSFIR